MREGKIFAAGKSKPPVTVFRSLLDSLGNKLTLKNVVHTHSLSLSNHEVQDNDAALLLCDYECSADFCGRWFRFLWIMPSLAFALFRPALMNHGKKSRFYSLEMLRSVGSSNGLGDWFSQLMSSPYHIGSCIGGFPPYAALGKVAAIQHEIIAQEGANANRSSLARVAGWQAPYLSCAFKRHVGIALEEYIKKIQFCSALRKIVAGEKQVKQIAYEAGYADPLYFGKVFKRRFGVSPNVLRADYRPPDLTYTPYDLT